MIDITINEREDVVIVSPGDALTVEDFKELANRLDDYINTHDRVPNLVLRTEKPPLWKNFDALRAHLKLVRDHHRIIKKVAVVSDSTIIGLLRPIVDHFTGAKIRRFPARAFDDAVNWAAMKEDHPGEFVLIEGLPRDVVGIDARGLITSRDYDNVLIPMIQSKLKDHDKVKLLFLAGAYFDGYSGGAMWDDAKFGFMNLRSFSKVALVSDLDWLRHATKMFAPLMPAEVMVFDLDEIDDAKAWIRT